MKQLFIASLFLLPAFAQTQVVQYGRVTQINSEGTPLNNVQIKTYDGPPITSKPDGSFRLEFDNKKNGDNIGFREISKEGYGLVNWEILLEEKVSGNPVHIIKVIMAPKGFLEESRLRFFKIWSVVPREKYEAIAKKLREERRQNKISEKEFNDKIKQLLAKKQAGELQVEPISKLLASFNTDDGDPLMNKLVTLIKTGDADEALKLIEEYNLLEKTNLLLERQKRNKTGAAADTLSAQINNHVALMTLAAKVYTLTLQPQKAEMLYGAILQLAPGNIESLKEISTYYITTGRFPEALDIYRKLQQLPVGMRIQARLLSLIGDVQYYTGKKDSAGYYYQLYAGAAQRLLQADPGNPQYKRESAMAQLSMGALLQSMHQASKAIPYFRKGVGIYENICQNAATTDTVWANLASAHTSIAICYTNLLLPDSALFHYEKAKELLERMYNDADIKPLAEPKLALLYSLLGETWESQEEYARARYYLDKALSLQENIVARFPGNEFTQLNLALVYYRQGKNERRSKNHAVAAAFFRQAYELIEKLILQNPQNTNTKYWLGIVYSETSSNMQRTGNRAEALLFAGKYEAIGAELVKQFPEQAQYIFLNAQALYMRAGLYRENLDRKKAIAGYEAAEKLLYPLHFKNPDDLLVLEKLADTYWYLGSLETNLLKHKKPARYYLYAAGAYSLLCEKTGKEYFCTWSKKSKTQSELLWPFGGNSLLNEDP